MFGKWRNLILSLALILSTVMIFAVPVGATAETQCSVSFEIGEALEGIVPEDVSDLLESVTIQTATGEQGATIGVALNGESLATLGAAADENGLYIASDILGDDVYAISWDEAIEALKGMMESSESGIDEEAIADFEKALKSMIEFVASSEEMNQTTLELWDADTPEKVKEKAEELFPNDPEMVDYIVGLFDKVIVEEGGYSAEGRDDAEKKITLTLSGEDYLGVCDTEYMRTLTEAAMAAEYPDASEEELAQYVEDALEEVRQVYIGSDMLITVETYVFEDETVGAELHMNMLVPDEENSVSCTVELKYDRLTGEDSVSHKADFEMVITGEDGGDLKGSYDFIDANDGQDAGEIVVLLDGTGLGLTYAAEPGEDGQCKYTISVCGCSDDGDTAQMSDSYIRFIANCENASNETLAKLESATMENSVNILQLSESDMNELLEQASNELMAVAQNAMELLPQSVLELFMSDAETIG